MPNRVISILGCGWLGKPLGKNLFQSGYVVRGSTTRHENIDVLKQAGILPFVFNVDELLSREGIRDFFDTDVLVISLPHGVRKGKAEEYMSQIRRVLQVAQDGLTQRIILISTTSVYPNLNRIVTEEDADNDNPIVKSERLVRDSAIPATILRFSGLYGPGRHPGKFLAGKVDVKDGDAPVNMIHLDDCIGIITQVIQQNIWNEVFNACADEHPTRRTFYTKAALELGAEPPMFLDDHSSTYKIVSSERVKKALRYHFIHKLS